jgi:hypothetical protein
MTRYRHPAIDEWLRGLLGTEGPSRDASKAIRHFWPCLGTWWKGCRGEVVAQDGGE